jgi:hypothetical protein
LFVDKVLEFLDEPFFVINLVICDLGNGHSALH